MPKTSVSCQFSPSRHAKYPWADGAGATSPIGDRHPVAGDLQDELLAGFGAHAARVGRCTQDVKLPDQPQRAHFFAWYTPVRAASPPQVAHPVNSGFFVSMPTRRPFSVPT